MASWYYAKDGAQMGPVDENTFATLVKTGVIRQNSLVWRSGMADWAPLRDTGWTPSPETAPPVQPRPEGGLQLQAGVQGANRPSFIVDPDPEPEAAVRETSERLIRKQPAPAGPAAVLPDPRIGHYREIRRNEQYPARYDGSGNELFPLYLKNILLTLFTLGIYRFWAQVAVRKYHYRHTLFLGGRFDYHATGRERFLGFCKGLVVLLPLAGLAWWVYQSATASGNPGGAAGLALFTVYAIMALLRPLIIVGSMAFQLSRTSWNNLRFRFTGRVGDLYKLYLRDFFLMIVTLGFYSYWHQINVMRYKREHSQLGGEAFRYTGRGGELLGINVAGMILSYVTLGIYTPWFIARLMRYHIEQTTFQGARFQSTLTGGQVLGTGLVCILQIVFTLGIGMPWAIARWRTLITNSTRAHGLFDSSRLAGEFDNRASAFAEGVGEAGELLENIGEIFGG